MRPGWGNTQQQYLCQIDDNNEHLIFYAYSISLPADLRTLSLRHFIYGMDEAKENSNSYNNNINNIYVRNETPVEDKMAVVQLISINTLTYVYIIHILCICNYICYYMSKKWRSKSMDS